MILEVGDRYMAREQLSLIAEAIDRVAADCGDGSRVYDLASEGQIAFSAISRVCRGRYKFIPPELAGLEVRIDNHQGQLLGRLGHNFTTVNEGPYARPFVNNIFFSRDGELVDNHANELNFAYAGREIIDRRFSRTICLTQQASLQLR